MILTGKCKEDFNQWLYEYDECYFTDESMQMYNNTLFIKWFDSVGIKCYSSYDYWDENFDAFVVDENKTYHLGEFNSRDESVIETIKKAGEIYNETFK